MKKKRLLFSISAIIIICIVYFYNEYKEKNLEEVINYDPSIHHIMEFNFDNDLRINDEARVREFIDFLSGYKVKKISNSNWRNTDVSNLNGFVFVLYGDKPVTIVLYENRLMVNGDPYEIVNDSIDMDWVKHYMGEMGGD